MLTHRPSQDCTGRANCSQLWIHPLGTGLTPHGHTGTVGLAQEGHKKDLVPKTAGMDAMGLPAQRCVLRHSWKQVQLKLKLIYLDNTRHRQLQQDLVSSAHTGPGLLQVWMQGGHKWGAV